MRLTIILTLLLGIAVTAAAADATVKVFVNGKLQNYNPPARVRDGKAYVPLRQGATSLGFTVEWLKKEGGAKVCDAKGCLLIRKQEGITVNGSMFLPLRKLGESFGAKVRWDPKARAVIITKAK